MLQGKSHINKNADVDADDDGSDKKNERCYLWMEISQWICDETEVIKSYVMRMNGRRNGIKFFFALFITLDFNELNFLTDDKTFNLLEISKMRWKENRSRTIWKYCHESWCTPHMHNYHDADHKKS